MPSRIKKLTMGIAALAALALGGSTLASAQNDAKSTPAAPSSQPAEQPGTETNDDAGSGEQQLSGPAADQAKKAALAAVGSGKVTDVSAENADKADAPEKGDTADKGEKPDPAYENQIAFDVEVTKADGSVVDVHLDKAFKVLGTEAGDAGDRGDHGGRGDNDGDQGGQGESGPEQADAAPAAPAAQ